MRRLVILLILLTLTVSLLNSGLYGESSLTALFQFWLFSTITSSVIFLYLALKKTSETRLPAFLVVLVILNCYIIFQAINEGHFGLTRYYWICSCLFLLSTYLYTRIIDNQTNDKLKFKNVIYVGITILSFLEALVVLFQYSGLIPSPTKLFRSTGTWLNPNVSAMFLALSLNSINYSFQLVNSFFKRFVLIVIYISVLSAILILFSRTAILVAIIFILSAFFDRIYRKINQTLNVNKRTLTSISIIIICSLLLILTVSVKEKSTNGRLQVWENAIGLIKDRPLTGFGFDNFEREINLYAIQKSGFSTGHVSIAYNDFLEIGAQGGIFAILIWLLFYLSLIKFSISGNLKVMFPILCSFFIIQITNFGFQAIPVFILFLIYTAVETGTLPVLEHGNSIRNPKNWIPKPVFFILLLVAISGLINSFHISAAFYKKNQIVKNKNNPARLNELIKLSNDLDYYASFHEAVGDLFLETKNYELALNHYLKAINRSSFPILFTKCGYCYQMLGQFESSKKEYLLVQKMEPEKLGPHLSLLKMYHQKKDTVNVLAEAETIMNKPVKIVNQRAIEIKQYADSIIKIIRPVSGINSK